MVLVINVWISDSIKREQGLSPKNKLKSVFIRTRTGVRLTGTSSGERWTCKNPRWCSGLASQLIRNAQVHFLFEELGTSEGSEQFQIDSKWVRRLLWSFRISYLISFRTVRAPLYIKQITGRELLLGSTVFILNLINFNYFEWNGGNEIWGHHLTVMFYHH